MILVLSGGLLYIQRTSTRPGAINGWGLPALSVCLPAKLCEGQIDPRVSLPWIALIAIVVGLDLLNFMTATSSYHVHLLQFDLFEQ